jgi:uncharacterized pyridoxamine 5'-phosphate oxidase family protein
MKREKFIRLTKWTGDIRNSNERRLKKILKEEIPKYKNIKWSEDKFKDFYIDLLNSLPARYKQKNSIEISGRITEEILRDAVVEKLLEFSNQNI